MSKIARIRILNLNYNNNTIKIDDEMFDFNGQNTLISLRNGGGKSVLVQMIVSLFVNRSYRDFGDRPFKSYFTTNRPTFIMTEWILDNKADRFLAGMMVRKSQREDNDAEELEMYTFTGNYSKACSYDIENLPVIRQEGSKKILRGFSECKNLLEEISKSESRNFRLYDMTSSYGRGQYFNKLREYQVNNKEWESIIRKVNQKESGLSELFQNAKDEKNLVENWFLRPIEDKLNQEKNKTDEFRKLAFQFIEQYKSNQSKIQRKGIIERYFEDTKPLKVQIDDYVQKDHDAAALRTEMILYVKALQRELKRLETEIAAGQEKIDQIKREQRRIVYEKLSYGIYIDEDRKTALLAKRTQQETAITELTYRKNQLTREIDRYDLHKLYQELKDFERQKAEVDAKLQVLLQKTEESKDECSATRFLRNSDRILEKKAPVLRNISEARSLASAAPKTAGRPTQEGGLFRLREGRLLPPLSLPFRPPGEVTLPALRPGLLRAPGRLHWPLRARRTPSTRRPQAPTRCRQSRTSTSCRCAIPSRPCCMRHALRGAVSTRGTPRGGSRSVSTWKGSPRASGSARRR